MRIEKNSYSKIPARMISISAMFAAFTLLFLYLSYVIPNMKFTFYFLSSIFIMGILIERMPGIAIIMYIAASGISLLILPYYYALPYIIFFGHYGIGKYYIETYCSNKIVAYILKLLYFNAAMAGIYFSVIATGMLPMAEIFAKLSVWAWIAVFQIVFVVFDYIYSKATVIYIETIRSKLIR